MEFRLSDETVSNANEYRTVRSSYAGASGKAGGNWLDFKQWLVANGFTCTYNDQVIPSKANGTQLGAGVINKIQEILGSSSEVILGLLTGSDNGAHELVGEGDTAIWSYEHNWAGAWWTSGFSDKDWTILANECSTGSPILLVRPL